MRYISPLLAMILSACGSSFSTLQPAAEKALENVTCPQSQVHLYNVLYTSLTELQSVPTERELRKVFLKALSNRSEIQIDQKELLKLVSEFYGILLKTKAKDSSQMLEKVTALEVGDQTTEEARKTQVQLKQFLQKWDQFRSQQIGQCAESPGAKPPQPVAPQPGTPVSLNPAVYGARKSLITAYQSCEADEKPAMTLETENVVGIRRMGTHADGVGGKRIISDLRSVQETHYYLQTKDRSSSCRDTSTNPMIYDYGGKPYATSDLESSLNFFKNSGSGTSVLGIDCSGYVFSAIASGGLKIHPDKKMRAILSHGINARMYMDPVNNGLTCFEKVKMGVSGTLKAGDIAAIGGHVVMIDSVGKDPLGLQRAKTISHCSALDSSGFNFVIIQSSPSKNAIGINKYFAADYLADAGGTIQSGFEKYAQEACKAKFNKKDVLMQASGFQVIRHKLTPSCMDQPLRLVGESCASTCRSLASSGEAAEVQVATE